MAMKLSSWLTAAPPVDADQSHMTTTSNVCSIFSFRVFKKASPNGKVSVHLQLSRPTCGLILIGCCVAPPSADRLPGEAGLCGSGGSGGVRR